MKQYLIFSQFDFKFQQTDNEKKAREFAACEDFFVADVDKGTTLGLEDSEDDKPIEILN